MSAPRARRWVVDAIDGDVARVEEDGERLLTVPRWMLPASAREGDVLAVRRDPDGRGAVTITLAVDPVATREALDASRRQVDELAAESRTRDAGGDVAL